MQIVVCGDCAYWERNGDVTGECRRTTPAFIDVDGENWRVWPTTVADDWCGDARPAPPGFHTVA